MGLLLNFAVEGGREWSISLQVVSTVMYAVGLISWPASSVKEDLGSPQPDGAKGQSQMSAGPDPLQKSPRHFLHSRLSHARKLFLVTDETHTSPIN